MRIPREVPAIVAAVVQARGGRDWRRHLTRLLAGDRFGLVGLLRPEVAWVLRCLGYGDDVIAPALGISRAGIVNGRRRFVGRLAGDPALRAWLASVLPADEGVRAAGGAA